MLILVGNSIARFNILMLLLLCGYRCGVFIKFNKSMENTQVHTLTSFARKCGYNDLRTFKSVNKEIYEIIQKRKKNRKILQPIEVKALELYIDGEPIDNIKL